MTPDTDLRASPPSSLTGARAIAHKATQALTMAARANLTAAPDDSHSNLGWDSTNKRFLSQPLPIDGRQLFVGLTLSPLQLSVIPEGGSAATLNLDGKTIPDALSWLDQQLAEYGLKPASQIKVPYELPEDAENVETFSIGAEKDNLSALTAWFGLAHALLSDFANGQSVLKPGPSPVRCWPHHFDIATYVQLQEGDFETAKGIGVGMSPGDESYNQPYFYINPWPHLDPSGLPDLPPPGHWHTEGFVGAIATGDEALKLDDVATGLKEFISSAFHAGRGKLGA